MDEREYRREYERKRYALRKSMMINFLGGVCVVCGATEALEIHHVDPSQKLFNLTDCYSHPWPKLVDELKKCELRCVTHHDDCHATDHGRGRMYRRGCRCDLCVAKFRADGRRYSSASKARKKGHTKDGRRLKIPYREIEQIRFMRASGASYGMIVAVVGRPHSTVFRIANMSEDAVAYVKDHATVAQEAEARS